jgi:hypothetical protein
MNKFHGVVSENLHPYSLKFKFGKARRVARHRDIARVYLLGTSIICGSTRKPWLF